MERRHGAHYYNGKRTDRFKRMFSKLGVKKIDLSLIFEQIEKEKNRPTEKNSTA